MEKQQPKMRYGKKPFSLAVFESTKDDGNNRDFYSLQKSRKVDNEWKNDGFFATLEEVKDLRDLIDQAVTGA